ncbi:MAG: peptidase M28, partial [Phycisphaerae bacterium]|nr:peptidase M28 [Phycisphaerae bacterium]
MMSVTGPTDSLQVPQATAASFRGSCRLALFLGAGLVVAACSAPSAPSAPAASAKAHAAEKPSPHAATAKKNGNAAAAEAALLSNIRQLTFAGRRTGEAYFSADGSRLVFQSEREPDNPFYQIYLMDLATGATRRLSPGHGKTTCAWIHPQGSSAIFASTHHDPEARAKQKKELADRAANKQRRYAWDYDENYDIFEKDLKTGKLRNLTRTRGYDAEACFSPDGKSIVFASNRQAFAGGLSAEDAATFKHDKSFMIDLYLMNRDGSSVRRLTDVPGYDGGPFFSADGSRICWRRFAKDGATAEIFTMRPDGSDQRQLTRMGAMSWAPFFHPSGQYLIFATNKHGFGNFELYLVDAEGRHDPVRVTQTDGFDGLPVFSPDGETLAWTSTRTPQKQSQVFTATWHHHLALAKLGLASATSVDLATEAREIARSNLKAGQAWITATDLSRHVHTLASPRFQGRGTGTAGERQATAYVAEVFAQLGLEPAGSEGFFQPFSFTTAGEVGKNNRLASKLAGHDELPAHLDKDWRPVSFSATGGIPESAVVFAGFGITTESGESKINYDSYVHLDVKDKWVMVLRNVPAKAPGPQKQALRRFAPLQRKAELARERGARGIIFVSGPNSTLPTELVPWRRSGSLGDRPIAAISVSNRLAGA